MNNNMFYRNYNPYFKDPYKNYFFYPSNYYNFYNENLYNKNYTELSGKQKNTKPEAIKFDEEKNNYTNNNNNNNKDQENNNRNFKIGPLNIKNNKICFLGYSFAIDDLIIVALIVFLLIESDCDYMLIIVLGLILLDINFSSLNLFS